MNSKKMVLGIFITLFLVFSVISISITADKTSKSLKGEVIVLDKDGKKCAHAVSGCCPGHQVETCDHKYGLKTSDDKIHLFAEKSKDNKVLDFEKFSEKKVTVNGYICPVSKHVMYSEVNLLSSKSEKKEGCCPKSKTSAAKVNN